MKFQSVKFAILLFAAIGSLMRMADGQCVSPPSGLIAWWPGDGNANDASGNSLNGVLMNGTSFTTGVAGQAFNFDGAANYVQVATSDILNLTEGQQWTIEGWIEPLTNSYMTIAHKGLQAGADSGLPYWSFYFRGDEMQISSNTYPIVTIVDNNSDVVEIRSSSGGVTIGQWNHVAMVASNMGGSPLNSYAFFVNGRNVGLAVDTDLSPVGSISNSAPFWIGAQVNRYGQMATYFDGQIDELSIYNRALTANEIASIYSAGGGGKCKPFAVNIALNPGVMITITNGTVGQTYGIQSNTNLNLLNGWIGVTNLQLTAPTQIWVDSQPDSLSCKFFRVVPGPVSIP
jgi:hypothetical protein